MTCHRTLYRPKSPPPDHPDQPHDVIELPVARRKFAHPFQPQPFDDLTLGPDAEEVC